MSDVLAIAAVTAVLKSMLENSVTGLSLNGDVSVTSLPPDRIKVKEEEKAQINLFLYQVSHNQGWKNTGLPSRNRDGVRLSNPPLALDLYYLLTVYGKEDFDDEILLGYAMQTLHETPVLSRGLISKLLASAHMNSKGSSKEELMKKILASGLANQVELIKIVPYQMNTEEISKLWATFQTNYRTSVFYHLSVLLIESKQQTRSALPVLKREIEVFASLIPPFPTLIEVKPLENQHAVQMGEILTLNGHHLYGDEVEVCFKNARSIPPLNLKAEKGATSTEIQVKIPEEPADPLMKIDSPYHPDNWKAGIYSIAGVVKRTENHELVERMTNELPVSIAPKIKSIKVTKPMDRWEITVECTPKVWKDQKVTLVIGDREISAGEITDDKTNILSFKSPRLLTGEQRVRLRVDGVESILINRKESEPAFDKDPNHTVTIV